jgi:DNA mismatch repair ATPase MutS
MKYIYSTLLASLLTLSFLTLHADAQQEVNVAENTAQEETAEPSLYAKIAEQLLPTLDESYPEHVETGLWASIKDSIKLIEQKKIFRKSIELSQKDATAIALMLIERNTLAEDLPLPAMTLSRQTWSDLTMYADPHNKDVSLHKSINRTKTAMGSATLASKLSMPQVDIATLSKRQDALSLLHENTQLHDDIVCQLKAIGDIEQNLLALWRGVPFNHIAQKNPTPKGTKHFLSKFIEPFSNSPLFQEITTRFEQINCLASSAIVSGYSAGAIFFGSKFIAQGKTSEKFLGPVCIAVGLLYGMIGLLPLYAIKDIEDMYTYCQAWLSHIGTSVKSIRKLADLTNKHNALKNSTLGINQKFTRFLKEAPAKSAKLAHLITLLDTNTFKGKSSYLRLTGKIKAAKNLIQDIKDLFIDALIAVGELDCLAASATLLNENGPAKYCLPRYSDAQQPSIKFANFWHPMIDPQDVVCNDIALGNFGASNNAIITGPNAGGKSTVLKAVAINLLLAQTIGVCPADSALFTPFKYINTYLNITDDIIAGNSLFKAEVLRAQELVNNVEELKNDEFSFTILDEMFCGTSPTEGAAASYSVAKHLGRYGNSMIMCATHFPLLTKLESDSDYLFKNYKVSVIRNDDTTITYPYKLDAGAANQHVAIDILRLEGFNSKILDDAYAIVKAAAA